MAMAAPGLVRTEPALAVGRRASASLPGACPPHAAARHGGMRPAVAVVAGRGGGSCYGRGGAVRLGWRGRGGVSAGVEETRRGRRGWRGLRGVTGSPPCGGDAAVWPPLTPDV